MVVESYHVDKDVYRLRYGVDGYTKKLELEDVLQLLQKSRYKKQHEANIASVRESQACAACAVCYEQESRLIRPVPDQYCKFSQPTDHRSIDKAADEDRWIKAEWLEIKTMEKMGCCECLTLRRCLTVVFRQAANGF